MAPGYGPWGDLAMTKEKESKQLRWQTSVACLQLDEPVVPESAQIEDDGVEYQPRQCQLESYR